MKSELLLSENISDIYLESTYPIVGHYEGWRGLMYKDLSSFQESGDTC